MDMTLDNFIVVIVINGNAFESRVSETEASVFFQWYSKAEAMMQQQVYPALDSKTKRTFDELMSQWTVITGCQHPLSKVFFNLQFNSSLITIINIGRRNSGFQIK